MSQHLRRLGEQQLHPLGADELSEIMRSARDLPQAFADRDHQQLRQAGRVGGGQEQQPAGREPVRERGEERRRLGDMLDHLHRGDQVEPAVERLDVAGAIIDVEAGYGRMLARDRDDFGGRIDRRHCRTQPRQRFGEQSGAASDVERGFAVERSPAALVGLPVLVNLIADIFQADRIELVQHRRPAVRIPPVGGKPAEALGLLPDDGRRCHGA
jgi:hypothetical protein